MLTLHTIFSNSEHQRGSTATTSPWLAPLLLLVIPLCGSASPTIVPPHGPSGPTVCPVHAQQSGPADSSPGSQRTAGPKTQSGTHQEPIFTPGELEKILKQKEERAARRERELTQDATLAQTRLTHLAEQTNQLRVEIDAAAEKLDAASRDRLTKISTHISEALAAHNAAIREMQTCSTSAVKETLTKTKARLEEAVKRASDQLEQTRQQLNDQQKYVLDMAINAAKAVTKLPQ